MLFHVVLFDQLQKQVKLQMLAEFAAAIAKLIVVIEGVDESKQIVAQVFVSRLHESIVAKSEKGLWTLGSKVFCRLVISCLKSFK
jgi:hypothetical protein